jgi:2-polyprenyl-6-methoxyphenol hydroxylase-like FAD-dependent oxidoreductase
METTKDYDVLIIGAGLAGLSLARQLLLNSGKCVLLLDRREAVPPPKQKVGEATVQLSGYYFSKVLDLEEHLLREHYPKYNLRFYWKTEGRSNRDFEDYGQSYIRAMSNIPTYQLDRNKLEAELLRLNLECANFEFRGGVTDLSVELSGDERPHTASFRAGGAELSLRARWVVDTSGRGKFLARKLGLTRQNPIRHGATWMWVEGLLNVEKLTDRTPRERRLSRDRAATGHMPFWLATNHFCGEGFWFWTIPLQGKTSLGLVYDSALVAREEVSTPAKLVEWVCREFPLFARDLPHRKILDHSSFKDFSYDCAQTIDANRWALSGEAGRFTDPLYSPGGDLIALHNTMITDAVLTEDGAALASKARLYGQVMRAAYDAYVPAYAVSYNALGDQETMTLKYTWELAAYFAFYVFPFINDLFTDARFLRLFLSKFSRLGPISRGLQRFISDYYEWKKENRERPCRPVFNDFTRARPLAEAAETFFSVGLTASEAARVLDEQLAKLRELARFTFAHASSVVLCDECALTNRAFVEGIDPENMRFDPEEIRARYAAHAASEEFYEWRLDPFMLGAFRTPARPPAPAPGAAPEQPNAYAGRGGL